MNVSESLRNITHSFRAAL